MLGREVAASYLVAFRAFVLIVESQSQLLEDSRVTVDFAMQTLVLGVVVEKGLVILFALLRTRDRREATETGT